MKKEIIYKKEISQKACLPEVQFRESYRALISLLINSCKEVIY
jgi:hypothetical protein